MCNQVLSSFSTVTFQKMFIVYVYCIYITTALKSKLKNFVFDIVPWRFSVFLDVKLYILKFNNKQCGRMHVVCVIVSALVPLT